MTPVIFHTSFNVCICGYALYTGTCKHICVYHEALQVHMYMYIYFLNAI